MQKDEKNMLHEPYRFDDDYIMIMIMCVRYKILYT